MYNSLNENNRKTLIEADRFYQQNMLSAKSPRRTSKSRLFNFQKKKQVRQPNYGNNSSSLVTQSSDSSVFNKNLRAINLKIVQEENELNMSKKNESEENLAKVSKSETKNLKNGETVQMIEELHSFFESRRDIENSLYNEISEVKKMVSNLGVGDSTEQRVLQKMQQIESSLIEVN